MTAIAVLLLIIASATLFAYDAAKGFVLSVWYGPKVTSHFNDDFGTVNPRLHDDGIHFEGSDSKKNCGPTSGYPSGGRYIFTCAMYERATVKADEAFIEKWRKNSPGLEKYLLSDGWQKEWNQKQPIDTVLDSLQNSSSIQVNYVKIHEDTVCRLTLGWIQPTTPNHLTVDEVCEMSRHTWGI